MFKKLKDNIMITKQFQIGLFEIEGMLVRGAFHNNDRLLITPLLTTYIPIDIEIKTLKTNYFIDNYIFKKMIIDYEKTKDTSFLLPLCEYKEAVDNGFKIESNLYL